MTLQSCSFPHAPCRRRIGLTRAARGRPRTGLTPCQWDRRAPERIRRIRRYSRIRRLPRQSRLGTNRALRTRESKDHRVSGLQDLGRHVGRHSFRWIEGMVGAAIVAGMLVIQLVGVWVLLANREPLGARGPRSPISRSRWICSSGGSSGNGLSIGASRATHASRTTGFGSPWSQARQWHGTGTSEPVETCGLAT